jgi:hypothetical protein
MDPNFTRHHLQAATASEVFAEANKIASEVAELDWDKHSVWGQLGGYEPGSLMLHHAFRPLAGECPCGGGDDGLLCVHIAAVALAYLGDDQNLESTLAALEHADLVTLLCDLADRSTQARRIIEARVLR